MSQSALKIYLDTIAQALRTGQSGEHTHRPALEALLEALGGDGVDAINEPRQIACGAPDFIVVRGVVPDMSKPRTLAWTWRRSRRTSSSAATASRLPTWCSPITCSSAGTWTGAGIR